MQCCKCNKQSDATRLPFGWKRYAAKEHCPDCWKSMFVVRSITIPISNPSKELWSKMRECWEMARSLANWAITTMYLMDTRRTPDMETLPKISERPEKIELYKLFQNRYDRNFWKGSTQSANCVLRMAEKQYNTHRWNVLWCGNESLLAFRSDRIPFPLDQDQWSITLEDGGAMKATLSLPGDNKESKEVTLKGGNGFRRQQALLKKVISGEAVKCEAAIYVKKEIINVASAKKHSSMMAKFVIWLPRLIRPVHNDRVLLVKTTPNSFIEAKGSWQDATEDAWVINGDDIRQRIIGYNIRLYRSSQDTKHEKRWPQKVLARMVDDRRPMIIKHHNRINSWIHESTTALANYAQRQHVSLLDLDTVERSYIDEFQWFKWIETLKYKLDERGIQLISKIPSDDNDDSKKKKSKTRTRKQKISSGPLVSEAV